MVTTIPGNVHLDQAIERAVNALSDLIGRGVLLRAVLINDLFGRLRVAVWPKHGKPDFKELVSAQLSEACKALWSGTVWVGVTEGDPPGDEDPVMEAAWQGGIARSAQLRVNDRHRNRTSWFLAPIPPPSVPPLIVAFYSFKGGVGRTTAAAALAVSWARRGRRIAAIDFDLDAPGLGRLLDADRQGTTARWGVVDYLLESDVTLPLDDYRHTCARSGVTGDGVIDVYPSGTLDEYYLSKLGKLDLEMQDATHNPLSRLLATIQNDSQPDLIIIDSRAGLSPAAGLVLGGIAHLHVIVSTAGEQALAGLRVVVSRLGEARLRAGGEQAECVLVHAMIPDHAELGARSISHFTTRAEDIFRDHYYAAKAEEDDRTWTVSDIVSSEAPHRASSVRYKSRLAEFRGIDDIADELVNDQDYAQLIERIDRRLRQFTAPVSTGDE
jgi:MinD-like ATPase involved in chromosome partitioning or flagellar assembly